MWPHPLARGGDSAAALWLASPVTHQWPQTCVCQLWCGGQWIQVNAGHHVDRNGCRILQKVHHVDRNGCRIQQKVHHVDRNGCRIQQKVHHVDRNGCRIQQKVHHVDRNGCSILQKVKNFTVWSNPTKTKAFGFSDFSSVYIMWTAGLQTQGFHQTW